MEPFRMDRGFDGLYGLEIVDVGEDQVRGRVAVEEHHKQPAGLVHGGIYASMAESLASMTTYLAVRDDNRVVMGQSNHTTFVRPILAGTVHAAGRARQRGRTTWVWDVEFSDDDERLCALSRVTIAVREARPGDQPR
jgi:1,4-dihydroxy-2-naphthoyl-CoA hydrolase